MSLSDWILKNGGWIGVGGLVFLFLFSITLMIIEYS
jgi:hypothetical protein